MKTETVLVWVPPAQVMVCALMIWNVYVMMDGLDWDVIFQIAQGNLIVWITDIVMVPVIHRFASVIQDGLGMLVKDHVLMVQLKRTGRVCVIHATLDLVVIGNAVIMEAV